MKVAELEGALLDYWVARGEDRKVAIREGVCHEGMSALYVKTGGDGWVPSYSPSTNWAIAGPIIERERINLLKFDDATRPWCAIIYNADEHWIDTSWFDCDWKGSTPLVAAMRAYVAQKFGEEVDDAPSVTG